MEAQNMSLSSEIPPHSHPDDAAAVLTTQSPAKGNYNITTSQDPDYDPEGRQGKAERKKSGTSRLGGGRVFTEEDEIAILRGLIEYNHTNNTSDPSSINWGKVHTYLTAERKLSSDVTVNQIYEKVRGLKKKYMKNLEKEKNGECSFLILEHDILVFKISKKIWGGASSDIDTSDGIGVDDEKMVDEEKEEAQHGYNNDGEDWGLSKSSGQPFSMNEKLRHVGSEKAMEMEMKWMKLRLREINHQIKRLEMESELIKIAMNEMKKV